MWGQSSSESAPRWVFFFLVITQESNPSFGFLVSFLLYLVFNFDSHEYSRATTFFCYGILAWTLLPVEPPPLRFTFQTCSLLLPPPL